MHNLRKNAFGFLLLNMMMTQLRNELIPGFGGKVQQIGKESGKRRISCSFNFFFVENQYGK